MSISLRMQVIQKYLLNKNFDDPPEEALPPTNPHFKTFETTKYTPVLTTKTTERQPKPKSKSKSKSNSKSKDISLHLNPHRFSQLRAKSRDASVHVTRDVSPISHSSLAKLSLSTTSHTFKKLRRPKETSNSVDIIKSSVRIIKKPTKMRTPKKHLTRSPRKVHRTPVTEISLSRESSRTRDIKPKVKVDIEKAWRQILNISNGIEVCTKSSACYTVFIGKGNNSILVKSLFLKRPWWKVVETKETANFVWTQWKDKAFIAELKGCSLRPVIKDEQIFNVVKKTMNKLHNGRFARSADLENIGFDLIQKSNSYIQLICDKIQSDKQRLYNKLEFNNCLTNKRGLYMTMRNYYNVTNQSIFDKIPLTFTVESQDDLEYQGFLEHYNRFEAEKKETHSQNLWIVKPGEFTNRGNGISVCQTLEEINAIIKPVSEKSYIIQKYIENPLLINKRKFDIRCYAMITSINGVIQGYFYMDGYLRTTSKEFNIEEISNPFIHLTNDAIQKHSAEYGKYETGNKMSYREFQKYLDQNFPDKKVNFIANLLPQIKEIVKDTMKGSFLKIDKNKRLHCMEVFGYDFMIDKNFKPWLIEINTNPCLETTSPHLRNIIPTMLDNAFKIALDSLFPPPGCHKTVFLGKNRFELVFHENVDGRILIENLGENIKYIEEL